MGLLEFIAYSWVEFWALSNEHIFVTLTSGAQKVAFLKVQEPIGSVRIVLQNFLYYEIFCYFFLNNISKIELSSSIRKIAQILYGKPTLQSVPSDWLQLFFSSSKNSIATGSRNLCPKLFSLEHQTISTCLRLCTSSSARKKAFLSDWVSSVTEKY